MALRFTPPGEDPVRPGSNPGLAGHIGPRSTARPVAFSAGPPLGQSPASPPGENKDFIGAGPRGSFSGSYSRQEFNANQLVPTDEIENQAQADAEDDGNDPADQINFLAMVREAEATSARYVAQVNRRAWTQSMRAYNNEHFIGSKYTRVDWRNRSKFFRPKTRSMVKKDMAAVAASLFGNIDAINCLPGNESDPRQRAAAAIMEELVNYRTDRASGKAAFPWFQVAMGARQDALITGVCISKQYWKFKLRKAGTERVRMADDVTGEPKSVLRDVWVKDIDRPECDLIPPENFTIDPAADWRDPVQSAGYVIIKWPMHLDEVRERQEAPINPWNDDVPLTQLLANSDSGTTDTSAIRRARELGLDRMDESQTGTKFQIVWVYEVYMRVQGEDYTFFSAGDKAYLTDPKPVREVYPEQFGERPLTMGVINLDAHRVFPMSSVESWQQHQGELNDIINLRLDAVKQNVMPVTKIVKGRGVDLDQVKRRAHGSAIMVQEADDVTFDRPQEIPNSVAEMTRELELEMDDLGGQFNGQTAENNNALSRTLGGLKLVSGAANAVQEFDARVWIETWCAPTLSQIVRLEQFYEHDDVVLGLCGDRAQLFEKHGVSEINDDLMEQEVTVLVSVGLGAGDPQQRLMKLQQVVALALPVVQNAPEFQSGEIEIDAVAFLEECFSSAGYRDGGARFFKKGKGKSDPLGDLKAAKLKSEVDKNTQTGKAAMITALANAAKQALGERTAEAGLVDQLVGRIMDATQMGHEHGHRHNEMLLSAMDHGHRHGMAIRGQAHQERQPQLPPGASAPGGGGTGTVSSGPPASAGGPPAGGPPPQAGAPSANGPPNGGQTGFAPEEMEPSFSVREAAAEPAPPNDAQPDPMQQQMQQLRGARYLEMVRGPDGRLKGFALHDNMPALPPPAATGPPGPPPLPPFAQMGA